MNDKEKLRQKLLEQTLGKDAKNRSISSFSADLESVFKYQQDSINKLSQGVDKETLKKINEEIKKDFGVSFDDEDVDIKNLDTIKEEMKKESYYHDMIDMFIHFIRKAKTVERDEYSLLIYNYKNIYTLIEEFVKKLFSNHFLKSDKISYVDFSHYTTKNEVFYQDVYDALYSDSSFIVFDHIEELPIHFIQSLTFLLKDKEMPLTSRYVQVNGVLKETNNQLVKEALSSLKWNHKYILFLSYESYHHLTNKLGVPFIKEVDECKEFVELKKEDYHLYLKSEINKFKEKVKSQFSIDLEDNLYQYVTHHKTDDIHIFLENVFEKIYDYKEKYQDIKIKYIEQELYVEIEDQKELLFQQVDQGFDEIDQQLQELVGLSDVKKYLKELKQYYHVFNKRKAQGKKVMDVSKHMIFTGNPGTGKTTVARLLAQYLKAANILTSGHLIEVSRKDLVGQYVGHTANLTSQVISSALGGVLFIDEAYSLYRGRNDSFGLEAIDTLVKAMEDKRDEFVVVLAGYQKEMDEFLESNSGLRSRFSNIIHFDDYTGEELYQIACSIASSKDYIIDRSCKEQLIHYYELKNSLEGGNGRLARNSVEKAMIHQASRESEDDLLLLEDFEI